MKVAVISDIHENYHNLLKALEIVPALGVARIWCLGDLMNTGIAHVLAGCGLPTFCIWGNNDGDKVSIVRAAMDSGGSLQMGHQTYAFVEAAGRQVFLTHYPDLAGPVARSQDFDAVFYGHDHRQHQEWVGACLVANPGEVSAHKTGEATFAVYDAGSNSVEFVPIPGAISLRTDYVLEQAAWRQVHPEGQPGLRMLREPGE